ncbi:MAG: RagB/SusD family nutrient uptake outer membrane protein [Cyclobacteriaceae bacterium]
MKVRYPILFAVVIMCFPGCKEDFLDVKPLDKYSDAAVWEDPVLVQSYVNNIYMGIPFPFTTLMLSSCVDESMAVWDWESSLVTQSVVSPSYLAIFDAGFWTGSPRYMTWNSMYRNVRACNLFFEKVGEVNFDDEAVKQNLIGQVTFLRAYFYHQLVSLYGGVPIITEAYEASDNFQVARNSYADCVQFIVEECDKAAALLDEEGNKAYATKGAALTLKSRVLLYAASDVFNSNASWAGGYSNPELVSYISGDQTSRWQAAKDAAKAVIDLGMYSLYGGESPASRQEATDNFAGLFLNDGNEEDIFLQFYDVQHNTDWDGPNPGLFNGPNGWHNWGGNTPTGQFADAFEMNDGSEFDWSNGTHASNPYVNRDPRFYASILYEGASWRERPADVVNADPQGIVQVGIYQKNGVAVPGLDTRKSPIEDWNGSYTGYYLRKFIDPSINHQYERQELPWRRFRYAEVLLNYAEACIELGQEDEAKVYLNKIRARAGMPVTDETGVALKDRYRNERRVELGYEEHRYYDVRRWMIAPSAYEDAQGVIVTGDMAADGTISNRVYAPDESVQERAWNPSNSFYFLPIKLDEINRNSLLVQNPQY